MEKIKVTAQQRANAIEALEVMWPSVPRRNVATGLMVVRDTNYRTGGDECSDEKPNCGSVACFYGWVKHWPNFKRQLKRVTSFGMNTGSLYLFGKENLWHPRETREDSAFPSDRGFRGSDHALVTRRLNWLIANSEVQP